MRDLHKELGPLVDALPPITLEEMAAIRLMNRTDTKFVTDLPTLARLLEMVRGGYYAQQTCGHRISPYSTVYWDHGAEHALFRAHLCGHRPRTKVRVRTYLDSGCSFLEVKKKDNHGITHKTRVAVPSARAVLDEGAGAAFLEEQTGWHLSDVTPTLGNRFSRITLVNKARTERLTIDFDLTFHNYETRADASVDNIAVIELKRDGRAPSPILDVLRRLRVKPAAFSKYCVGISLTDPALPQNRLKPRLRNIHKIATRQQSLHP